VACSVKAIVVRHVRPGPGDEERLRRVVAELQAASILRAARRAAGAGATGGENVWDMPAAGSPGAAEKGPEPGRKTLASGRGLSPHGGT
jgi:hypothetical protein